MPDETPGTGSLSRGAVFAASGDGYVALACEAARSLKEICPDLQVDLFTDVSPPGPSPFDEVHWLEHSWFRPKFEALRRSRFDLTLYLDNDLVFLADISDVFDVLARHDVVAAHNERRNSATSIRTLNVEIPPAFPQISGGVVGLRKSEETQRFLTEVEKALKDHDLSKDQIPMREQLYLSGLRLGILPVEYNLMRFRVLDSMGTGFTAPRILHLRGLQEHLRNGGPPRKDWTKIVGTIRRARIQAMLDADRTLAGKRRKTVYRGPLNRFFDFTPPR